MRPFWQAIRLSFRYKWSIFGAFASAMIVALLWGASISTIYPFVRIVFRGDTVHTWIDREIGKAEKNVEIFQEKLTVAESEGQETYLYASRLSAEKKALAWYQAVQPSVKSLAPATPFGTLVLAMMLLLAATILKGVFLVIGVLLVSRIAHGTVRDMRRVFYRKALLMDQRRIDQVGTSDLMTMLTHNMTLVNGGLNAFYGKSIREPLKMLACLAGAAFISWRLLLLSLIVVPFGAFAIQWISRKMRRASKSEMGGMASVFQTLIETFSAIKTVRIFNQESNERKRFKRESQTLYRMGMRISFFDAILRPITETLGIIVVVVAILTGAYLVLNQQTQLFGLQISQRPLDPEMLMVFFAMLAGAADPARKMGEIYYLLVRGGAACENLYQTFEAENKITIPDSPVPVAAHHESIEFKEVFFRYNRDRLALKKFSLRIEFGEKIAICGANGSGKSTVANLICRFYDPNRGSVLIDGVDISQMNPRKLRRQVAWCTQDPVMFQGTIEENLVYANPKATSHEIERAIDLVELRSFVEQLPQGIQTEVGEEGNQLSGGQRQKISLARLILSDPKIVILDEATSQMDSRSREQVHRRLQDFLKDRTTLIITHDSESLELANRIIFLRDGQIRKDWERTEATKDARVVHRLLTNAA